MPLPSLILRRGLGFPGNFRRGFNSSHVAAKNLVSNFGFSGVATQSGLVDLLTGKSYAFGTSTASIRAIIGPAINYNTDGQLTSITGQTSAQPTALTFAAIFTANSTAGFQSVISSNSVNPDVLAINGGSIGIYVASIGTIQASIALSANVPYFFAGSFNSGACNCVLLNLKTGAILTATASAGAPETMNGTIVVGGNQGVQNANSYIAAGMCGLNNFMSARALLSWAKDPWGFWYPTRPLTFDVELVQTVAASVTPVLWGFEQIAASPVHLRRERAAAGIGGDTGTQAPLISWFNAGWELQSPQPPHPRPERAASWLTGDPGIQAVYIPTITTPAWWETPVPFQLRRSSPRMDLRGDDGIQAPFIKWNNLGWEVQSPQPPHPKPERAATWLTGDQGIQAPFINWINAGSEIQAVQPPYRRRVVQAGDMTTLGLYTLPSVPTWGWESQLPLGRNRYLKSEGINGASEFASFNTLPHGFEPQLFQPPHPRYRLQIGDMSPLAPFVFVPPPTIPAWGWDVQPHQPRRPSPRIALQGDDGIQAPLIFWYNGGWEVQSIQPPHPRPERAGAFMVGDQGIYAPFIFIPPGQVAWGWETQAHQPRRPTPRFDPRGDDGIQAPYFRWINGGWEVQSVQPPYKINRIPALLRGDDGIYLPLTRWFNAGWEVQPVQPPHRKPERAGVIMIGNSGIDAPFIFVPPVGGTARLRTLVGTGL